jgi:hypothetical protein
MSEAKPSKEKPPEEQKAKRARRVVPTFQAGMLNDPQKGLATLLHRFEKLDDSAFDGSPESLALMMRTYQGWLYNLFPADFGDMCWKIADRKQVKSIVRDFVWDKRGIRRIVREAGSGSSDDEPPPRNFIDEFENPTLKFSIFLTMHSQKDRGLGICPRLRAPQRCFWRPSQSSHPFTTNLNCGKIAFRPPQPRF